MKDLFRWVTFTAILHLLFFQNFKSEFPTVRHIGNNNFFFIFKICHISWLNYYFKLLTLDSGYFTLHVCLVMCSITMHFKRKYTKNSPISSFAYTFSDRILVLYVALKEKNLFGRKTFPKINYIILDLIRNITNN